MFSTSQPTRLSNFINTARGEMNLSSITACPESHRGVYFSCGMSWNRKRGGIVFSSERTKKVLGTVNRATTRQQNKTGKATTPNNNNNNNNSSSSNTTNRWHATIDVHFFYFLRPLTSGAASSTRPKQPDAPLTWKPLP